MTKEKFFDDLTILMEIFGELDANKRKLEDAFDVNIFLGSNTMKISGEEEAVDKASAAIDALTVLAKKDTLKAQQINMVIDLAKLGKTADINELTSTVAITARGKVIRPKTIGQKKYVDAINSNKIVFGVGPAGTGKTYLAVALAVYAFKNHEIDKIILTRPAVEAGEKLGFLPGDLSEKVDPYLRPLFDALQEMLGGETYLRLIERGSIEIAPLAYMRGRTLSNSFIILDEAQNTTKEQMKMFLTRMGENSRIVVTGDITQVDLPHNVLSGLRHAISVLNDIDDIKIVEFDAKDVVRHELVTKIVLAYEKAEKEALRKYENLAEEKNNSTGEKV